MTAPNPVVNGDRPAPAEAGTGQMIAAALVPTTEPGVATAYPITRPDWTSWDEVTVEAVPGLQADLDQFSCSWCGWMDNPAVFRVHSDNWPIALHVGTCCIADAVTHAAEHGRVLVETAAL